MEDECQKTYNDAEQAWNQLVEVKQLKQTSQHVCEVKLELERLQASMLVIPIKGNMVNMGEKKDLRAKIDALTKV